jgi:hypothetical protein
LKGLLLQSDAQPPLGELALSKIDLENTKPQTPGRVIGLHGKLKLDAEGLLSPSGIRPGPTIFIPKLSRRRVKPTSVMAPPEDNCLKITDFIGFPRVATFQRKRITAY